jgi:hypothetical protein
MYTGSIGHTFFGFVYFNVGEMRRMTWKLVRLSDTQKTILGSDFVPFRQGNWPIYKGIFVTADGIIEQE